MNVGSTLETSHNMVTVDDVKGGWLQVNNTVIPQIKRHLSDKDVVSLVPMPVLQYGAGLFLDEKPSTVAASEVECEALSQMCKDAKLNFRFEDQPELISLQEVAARKQIIITELPTDDPFGKSKYRPEFDPSRTAKQLPIRSSASYVPKSEIGGFPKPEQNVPKLPKMPIPFPECTVNSDSSCVIDLSHNSKKVKKELDGYPSKDFNYPAVHLDMKSTHTSVHLDEPLDLSIKSLNIPFSQSVGGHDECGTLNQMPANYKRPTIHIRPVRLFGKKIPCLHKGNMDYVLVETLRKAFFPQCSLRAFMFMVVRSVGPFLYNLSIEDIESIKMFVKNPTCLMRCSKVVSLHDAEQMMPLVQKFLKKVAKHRQQSKGKNGEHQAASSSNQSSPSISHQASHHLKILNPSRSHMRAAQQDVIVLDASPPSLAPPWSDYSATTDPHIMMNSSPEQTEHSSSDMQPCSRVMNNVSERDIVPQKGKRLEAVLNKLQSNILQ